MIQAFSKIPQNILVLTASLFLFQNLTLFSQPALPRPAHIVIVMFENKGYSQMVGSSSAPYINSLLTDTNTALLSQYYALTHPSQPNYLMLFSGSNQGVTTDTLATATPFTTCNLGASLVQTGSTFVGYCEDMPTSGYLGANSGLYYRRHNPWSNWQGSSTNNLAAATNQPFTAFPANYALLPDLSFVVPNINNSMHYGSISLGDSWLSSNLSNYIQWSISNNSLLILTFDEDNGSEGNRILTFFHGPMVKGGTYSAHADHYDLLRTLEDIYNLPHCGNSVSATPINVWKPVIGMPENSVMNSSMSLFPNPATDQVSLRIKTEKYTDKASITLSDICGRTLPTTESTLSPGENLVKLNYALPAGVYCVRLSSQIVNAYCKLVIEER